MSQVSCELCVCQRGSMQQYAKCACMCSGNPVCPCSYSGGQGGDDKCMNVMCVCVSMGNYVCVHVVGQCELCVCPNGSEIEIPV